MYANVVLQCTYKYTTALSLTSEKLNRVLA